jgi:hypothetical protein
MFKRSQQQAQEHGRSRVVEQSSGFRFGVVVVLVERVPQVQILVAAVEVVAIKKSGLI